MHTNVNFSGIYLNTNAMVHDDAKITAQTKFADSVAHFQEVLFNQSA